MKSTFFLPLLAALPVALVGAQVTDISPAEFEKVGKWAEEYLAKAPECFNKCLENIQEDGSRSSVMPPCTIMDQESEDPEMKDYQNAMDCMCADKIWQAAQMQCALKNCTGDDAQAGLETALTLSYGHCAVYSTQSWPRPPVMLEALCLADDIPKGVTVPDEIEVFENAPDLLKNYEYAESWPEQTATTWAPNGTPIPETREPLECEVNKGADGGKGGNDEEETSTQTAAAETSGTKTGSGTKETGTKEADVEDSPGAAAGSFGGAVSMLMVAVAGVVGGLAVVL